MLSSERRRSTPAPKEEEKVNEEQWPLREVVFVEDVKNIPVGKVGLSGRCKLKLRDFEDLCSMTPLK